MIRLFTTVAVALGMAIFIGSSVFAAGAVIITQAKAIAGGVSPGDAAGFPITLSLPGTYKFETNIEPPKGKAGIVPGAEDITIDLNGFHLDGTANRKFGAQASFGLLGPVDRLTVRGGAISGFQFEAINDNANFLVVEDMRIVSNGGDGIVTRDYARIKNNTIFQNRYGISCTRSCLVEGNIISGNKRDGMYISSGTVLGNTIIGNTQFGLESGPLPVGFGNNTLAGNNAGDTHSQVAGSGLRPMQPNACTKCP